ncbi:MAG: hypothetical protein JWO46_3171 [Nocardioidaceae bacterium]|nr:hypothetical protein [Nocardioidaceae bacterium]
MLWRDAADTADAGRLEGVATGTAFASRWNALAAGADYYVSSAGADDCGDLLTTQRAAATALSAVTAQALPYDVQVRVAGALTAGAARVAGQADVKPKVAAAMGVLVAQTPTAVSDLAPAFTELAAADPADPAAVKQGTDDLALLAETSDAYVAVTAALASLGPPKPTPKKSGKNGG